MPLWACVHERITPPDEDGRGICERCGAVIQLQLTPQLLHEAFERVRRDFGGGVHHSMRCVETPEGWCCADDCRLDG